MRTQLRSLGLAGGAVAAVVTLGWASPLPSMVQLLATTALIMGGTEHPLVQGNGVPDGDGNYPVHPGDGAVWVLDYVRNVEDNYLEPTAGDRGDGSEYRLVAVHTPEEFAPFYGSKTFDQSVQEGADNLATCMDAGGCVSREMADPDPGVPDDEAYVIVGYSQSARIASIEKQRLIDTKYWETPGAKDVSFVFISNPNRPNGGVLMRFHGLSIPFLGVTMDGASPTDSCDAAGVCHLPTVDVVQQYDALGGDFPIYPLNLLAVANSLVASALLHGDVPYVDMDDADPQYQGQFGDTDYYMIGSDLVPLLVPLERLGVPRALLLAIDEPLRVLIETGYRRDISPGEPTPAQLVPMINPSLLANLLASIPVGLDDAIEETTGERPFGTTPSGIYGVGGDDADLEGAPAGFIPLGKPDPTTSTEVVPPAAAIQSAPEEPEIGSAERSVAVAPIATADSASVTEAPKETAPVTEAPKETAPVTEAPKKTPKETRGLHSLLRGLGDTDGKRTATQQRSEDRPKGPIRRLIDRRIGQRPDRSTESAPSPTSGTDNSPDNDPAENDSASKDAA